MSKAVSALLIGLTTLWAVTGCDQIRLRNTSTHVEPVDEESAFIVGSGEETSTTNYIKVFPTQIDWNTIRDNPLTFNPSNLPRGSRVGVRMSAGTRNVWSEVRVRRGSAQSEEYAGTMLTVNAVRGKAYVVRATADGDKARIWIADAQTDEAVSDVRTPTFGKPPPGYPKTPIIIFVPR